MLFPLPPNRQLKNIEDCIYKSGFSVDKIKTSEYVSEGTYAVVDQGKDLIAGYYSGDGQVYNGKLPVIIYGDHTNVIKFIDFPFICGADGVKVFNFKEGYDVKYFYYVFTHLRPETQGYRRHYSLLKNLQIPLPPLEIQKKIVAKLDELNAIITSLKIDHQIQLSSLEELWNSSLDLAFSPERERGWEPNSWKRVKLGGICDFVRGPFGGSLKKEIFKQDGYAIYEQQHAIYNQFSDIRYFIDEEKFNAMRRFELKSGDLIMSCSGTMGKVAIIPKGIKQGIINQALLKITPGEKINSTFLKLWMQSKNFQNNLQEYSQGAAIQNVASVSILKQIQIPLPDLKTQEKIVQHLDQVNEKITSLKAEYQTQLNSYDQLWAGSLDLAFKGELVK